jgi:hypothetical protein
MAALRPRVQQHAAESCLLRNQLALFTPTALPFDPNARNPQSISNTLTFVTGAFDAITAHTNPVRWPASRQHRLRGARVVDLRKNCESKYHRRLYCHRKEVDAETWEE